MRPFVWVGGLLALVSGAAHASPFWIAWEGDDWPESVGYVRSWGNWNGPNQGGAVRTLENGALTYDTLYDPGAYDYYYRDDLPGLELQPGETVVLEWRMKIDQAYSGGDPGLSLKSEDGWALGYTIAEDRIRSIFENDLEIPFVPYVWHDYQVVSSDLRAYDLFIDGSLAHQGSFGYVFPGAPHVGWGDAGQNFTSGSYHSWDWFRVGVVAPEPGSLLLSLLAWVTAWRGARRGSCLHICRQGEIGVAS
jgi:hypothetical protein